MRVGRSGSISIFLPIEIEHLLSVHANIIDPIDPCRSEKKVNVWNEIVLQNQMYCTNAFELQNTIYAHKISVNHPFQGTRGMGCGMS